MNRLPTTDENRLGGEQGLNRAAWFTIRLGDLPACNEAEVIGQLSMSLASAGFATQLTDQTIAWRQQLHILRQTAEALVSGDPACAYWMVALEYEIPRRGKRIDTVFLAPHVVMVIEFKNGATSYSRADLWQVEDYALDIRDFHEASVGVSVKPILVATRAPAAPIMAGNEDNSEVWCANSDTLPDVVTQLVRAASNQVGKTVNARAWLHSGYRPTPTIVEAARQVFAGHNVRDLSHTYADNLTLTTDVIAEVIREAKSSGRRRICFVTGVPGSGKTLAGLTAMQDARAIALGAGTCSFMSGNGPLVRVLREALIRDRVMQGNKRDHAERETGMLVQNVHQFIEEYGVRQTGVTPPDNVIAFDEAQRAWHAKKLSKRHKGMGRSEPDLVLDIMSRPESWSVVVALVARKSTTARRGLKNGGMRSTGQRPRGTSSFRPTCFTAEQVSPGTGFLLSRGSAKGPFKPSQRCTFR